MCIYLPCGFDAVRAARAAASETSSADAYPIRLSLNLSHEYAGLFRVDKHFIKQAHDMGINRAVSVSTTPVCHVLPSALLH